MGIVLPRVLSYLLLTPFYTRIFTKTEYGVVTELYAYVVFLIVILTYGLETGFFRFSDKSSNERNVYKTVLTAIISTSLIFIILIFFFFGIIAHGLQYPDNPEYIRNLGIIVALDAFCTIPFARLRFQNKPVKYAYIRIVEVSITLIANWFFLYYCPRNYEDKQWINSIIYDPNISVGYVLISNLIATSVKAIMLSKEIFFLKGKFDYVLLKRILRYSSPLLIAGLAGTINEAIDRVMLKHLISPDDLPLQQLGIYGANYKLAVLMTLFIQMFRYAAEPFFFSKKNEKNAKYIYASVMKYFIFSGVIIFLLVTLYIDIFKLFIGADFRQGLGIVPIVLMANLFMGIFYNLSVWYKLKNLTKYGAYLVITGAVFTIIINYLFIPKYGYFASAWGHFISYLVMVILSYYFSRKHYRINYDLKEIFLWLFVGISIYTLFTKVKINNHVIEYVIKTILLLILTAIFFYNEKRKKLIDESKDR